MKRHHLWFFRGPTSSPRPSPSFKMAVGETLAKATEILQESWSILSRDTCLLPCNLKPLFKQNEGMSSCFTWQNPHEFLEPFSSLRKGFSDHHFEWGEGPGNKVVHRHLHTALAHQRDFIFSAVTHSFLNQVDTSCKRKQVSHHCSINASLPPLCYTIIRFSHGSSK